ncbi:hypothetical protein D3C78_1921840 [compost metagenome]
MTPYIRKNKELFNLKTLIPENKKLRRPDISLTIDTIDDYAKVYKLINCLETRRSKVSLEGAIEICSEN